MLPHGVGSNEGGKEGKTGEGSKQRLICFPAWKWNSAAYFCIRKLPRTVISAHCSRSRCLAGAGAAPHGAVSDVAAGWDCPSGTSCTWDVHPTSQVHPKSTLHSLAEPVLYTSVKMLAGPAKLLLNEMSG